VPEQLICDPTLYQWLFFLRWHSRDSDEQRMEHARAFQEVLKAAQAWMGVESELPALPVSALTPPQVSERLATQPWQERDGTLRELEARTLLDAFYLQLGQARQGKMTAVAFQSLARWTHPGLNREASQRAYLGEALCLCAQVDEALSEDMLAELAAEIVQYGLGRSTDRRRLEGILLPCGFFVMVPDAECEVSVLLYPASANQQTSRFVHFILPQLFLSRLKARVIRHRYHHHLLPQAQKQEQELDALLKQAAQPRLHLEALEQLSADISRKQATFVETLSELEEQLETIRVNLRNVTLLMDDALWGEQRQRAQQLLTADMALFTEQIETDLRYLRITQQQADLALQTLLTVTGVRGTQWERRMTLLLGVFAVMAVAQAFPELAWWWRLVLIGLGSIAVGLGYWWLRQR
jgi:hypothetical protein